MSPMVPDNDNNDDNHSDSDNIIMMIMIVIVILPDNNQQISGSTHIQFIFNLSANRSLCLTSTFLPGVNIVQRNEMLLL